MTTNLCAQIRDQWWLAATTANRWKVKYECMQEIFYVLTGSEEITTLKIPSFADHENLNHLMRILTQWLSNENHIFTRIAILQLMPTLIQSVSTEVLSKYQNDLFQTLMTKQWTEKKKVFSDSVTPILILLWQKSDVKLNSAEIKPFLISALVHRVKDAKVAATDFIAKCTLYRNKHQQLITLFRERDIAEILINLSLNDKDKMVRLSATKAVYGLYRIGLFKREYEDRLSNNRRAKRTVEQAIQQYHQYAINANDTKISVGYYLERATYLNIWNTESTEIATNSGRLQRELLLYGYCRINDMKSIPYDILRLCLVMIGCFDFHWVPVPIYTLSNYRSPTYCYQNVEFQFVINDQKNVYIKVFIPVHAKRKRKGFSARKPKLYNIKNIILCIILNVKNGRNDDVQMMHVRSILSIDAKRSGKEIFLATLKLGHSFEFYGDINSIYLQIEDMKQRKLKIYNQNRRLCTKYRLEWNLKNIEINIKDQGHGYMDHYSEIFGGMWCLMLHGMNGLYLKVFSLPYNVSSIHIQWICNVNVNGKTKEVISTFCTLSLNHDSQRDSRITVDLDNKIDFRTVSFDVAIDILGMTERNYFSEISNIILKDNLVLYGIMDREYDPYSDMGNAGIDGITLQREIENVSGNDSNCSHAINDITTLLRNEYDEKILKLQNQIDELMKSTNNGYGHEVNDDHKNEENMKKVNDWLHDIVKLPQYFNVFIINGFDSLDMIKEINDKKDLDYIDIHLKAHQIKLMNEINKLRNA